MLATVVLTLGALGLLLSFFNVAVVAVAAESACRSVPKVMLWTNAALSTASKVCFIAVGLLMALRQRRTLFLAVVGFVVSLADSAYYLGAVVPLMAFDLAPGTSERAFVIGAWVPAVLAFLTYAMVLIYLRRPATRREFGWLDV